MKNRIREPRGISYYANMYEDCIWNYSFIDPTYFVNYNNSGWKYSDYEFLSEIETHTMKHISQHDRKFIRPMKQTNQSIIANVLYQNSLKTLSKRNLQYWKDMYEV